MNRKQLYLCLASALVLCLGLFFVSRFLREAKPETTALRSELALREGKLFRVGSSKPFTGLLIENFPGGARKLAIQIRDGRVHGASRGWFESGQLEVEESFVAGVSHGLRTRWHANGAKRSEERIENGSVSGPFSEWYDNGQLAVQMTMLNGTPDGVVDAWNRDGSPKSRTVFSSGKISKREFFGSSTPDAASQPREVVVR